MMSRKMNVNKMKHPSDVHGLAKHGERQFSRRSGYIFDSTLLVIIIVNQPHNANNFAYLSGGGTALWSWVHQRFSKRWVSKRISFNHRKFIWNHLKEKLFITLKRIIFKFIKLHQNFLLVIHLMAHCWQDPFDPDKSFLKCFPSIFSPNS